MLEALKTLDGVLADGERAGITFSGAKSQWLMDGVNVVGYVCTRYGRSPDPKKISHILK